MKKIIVLILLSVSLISCSDSDVDMDKRLYGTWVPKDLSTGGLIYKFNKDNTGAVYYIRQVTETGEFVCDECLTVKITNLSLEEVNNLHQLSMHLEEGGAFNNFYDLLTDTELRFMNNGQHCEKDDNAVIVEKKLSCE
ncbi:MAG: hypothetical protein E6767_20290 [Dysgonomonas sp.]|nr:hypothetical protein [Dysgonomonas sp.]